MATRGRHAPFSFKRRRARWHRHDRMRPDYPAMDEDEDIIMVGPGEERDSDAGPPPRG